MEEQPRPSIVEEEDTRNAGDDQINTGYWYADLPRRSLTSDAHTNARTRRLSSTTGDHSPQSVSVGGIAAPQPRINVDTLRQHTEIASDISRSIPFRTNDAVEEPLQPNFASTSIPTNVRRSQAAPIEPVQASCFVAEDPSDVWDIFCRAGPPPSRLRTEYKKEYLLHEDSYYMTTFLMSTRMGRRQQSCKSALAHKYDQAETGRQGVTARRQSDQAVLLRCR